MGIESYNKKYPANGSKCKNCGGPLVLKQRFFCSFLCSDEYGERDVVVILPPLHKHVVDEDILMRNTFLKSNLMRLKV